MKRDEEKVVHIYCSSLYSVSNISWCFVNISQHVASKCLNIHTGTINIQDHSSSKSMFFPGPSAVEGDNILVTLELIQPWLPPFQPQQ